ncbi:MAG: 4Fe-4S dicluster domain-containing protein [Pseudomonadota bacterium]|nr:4Fe-4S dicluster domain-containing protein [Pseudomonadota bacterium]
MAKVDKKWNLIVDIDLCENCNNCFLSCKDEHVGNDFPGYAKSQPREGHSWISIDRIERGQVPMVEASFMPRMCNHCVDAPCIKAAGDDSVYMRGDGIVIIDPQKARGRKDLVGACPYGAIYWNEEEQLPQKWIFDAHLLDQGWPEPRCTQACPTGALHAVKVPDSEMSDIIAREGLNSLVSGTDVTSRVHYKNLSKFVDAFVGGTVEVFKDGISDCLESAKVSVVKQGKTIGHALTDNYGDFKIDHIPENVGEVILCVEHASYGKQEISLNVHKSIYIGSVVLK